MDETGARPHPAEVTLDELDTLIAATPDAAIILADAGDWFDWFRPRPPEGAEVVDGGRVVYRGLPVWVVMPGQTHVLSAADAISAGYDLPEMISSAADEAPPETL